MMRDRAKRWRAGTAPLLARLHAGQLAALKRAKGGYPPDHLLGWHTVPDTGSRHEPPLRAVEGVARALLRAYAWPTAEEGAAWPPSGYRETLTGAPGSWRPVGPDWSPDLARWGRLEYDRAHDRVHADAWPDFRFELLTLVGLVAELRAALAGRLQEGAALRAMAVGMLFARLAFLLLDGEAIAAGAAVRFARPGAHPSRRDRAGKDWAERLPVIDEIDRGISPWLKGDARWERIAEIYREREREELPKAAAQKRLRTYRRNLGRLGQTSTG